MKRAAVVGWPIGHSRSPLIHRHWLTVHGIAGDYDRLAVEPERAGAFFAGFAATGLVGCNVTIPHKETAAHAAAAVTAAVERIGAANTLWIEDGRLIATNTDVDGFLGNLDDGAPGWSASPGPALVLGAGGAAAAIVDGLVGRGFDVRLCNRTVERAERLAARYPGRASGHGFDALDRLADGATVVVNTTSLGMKGEGRIPLDMARLPESAIVTDAVYVPLLTDFLAAAAARGLRTVDGLGMLLHQAAPAFERFFGVRPVVDAALRRLVEADL